MKKTSLFFVTALMLGIVPSLSLACTLDDFEREIRLYLSTTKVGSPEKHSLVIMVEGSNLRPRISIAAFTFIAKRNDWEGKLVDWDYGGWIGLDETKCTLGFATYSDSLAYRSSQ